MSGNIIQVCVKGLRDESYMIDIDRDANIQTLKEKARVKSGIPCDKMRLIFAGKQLRDTNADGTVNQLEDYGIAKDSNIFMVLRLLGGSNNSDESDRELSVVEADDMENVEHEDLSPPAKELPPYVETTDEPDMITFDDDKDGKRAKMPCGHAIGPDSLTSYCRSIIENKKFEFRCPHLDPPCNVLWDYYIVKKIAVLTSKEKKEFEIKLTENYLHKGVGIQSCPKCKSLCERHNKKDIRLICPICTSDDKKLYEFCWFCLREWKTSGTRKCGNSDCNGEEPRLRILKAAEKKVVIGVEGCPSIRACPKCGLLIEHRKACKHMTCRCGQNFCFICLGMADPSLHYTCGYYNTKCEIAPIQTTLPCTD